MVVSAKVTVFNQPLASCLLKIACAYHDGNMQSASLGKPAGATPSALSVISWLAQISSYDVITYSHRSCTQTLFGHERKLCRGKRGAEGCLPLLLGTPTASHLGNPINATQPTAGTALRCRKGTWRGCKFSKSVDGARRFWYDGA